MNHVFCTDCGFKITYNNAKPNFCQKCGFSIGGGKLAVREPNQSRANSNDDLDDDLNEDETSVDYVPSIRRLELEEEPSRPHQPLTLGTLFGNPTPPIKRTSARNIGDFIDERSSR